MKTIKKVHCANGSFLRGKAFRWPALLILGVVLFSLPAPGKTLTWTGGAGANWSSSGNWGLFGIPANGDTIIYQGSATNVTVSSNDILNLTLNQIQFIGDIEPGGAFDLRGNAFTLTNGILSTNTSGTNLIENSITIATADALIVVSNGVGLILEGNISGSVGANKAGAGTLIYQCFGDNTYTGTTLVSDGFLQLNVSGASAFGGPLVIGDGTGNGSPVVEDLQFQEISESVPITINKSGTLDLNNFNETIGPSLTLSAGLIYTGSGTLTLSPSTTITITNNFSYSSTIDGNLNIGSGTLTLQGNGDPLQPNGFPFLFVFANVSGSANIVQNSTAAFFGIDWESANTYSGNYVVNGVSAVYLGNSLALGNTNNTLTVNDQGQVAVSGTINLTNQSLTINGGNPGAAFFVDNGNGPCTNSWRTSFTFVSAGAIDIPTNCLLNLNGPIGGSGGLAKNGPGALMLSGTTANTYAGTTTVTNGTLLLGKPSSVIAIPGSLVLNTNATVRLLNHYQIHSPFTPVTLLESSRLDLAGFNEWVGAISLQGAQITSGAGSLNFSGNITVNPSLKAQSVISGNAIMLNQTCTITNTGSPNFSPDLVFSANLSSSGIGGGGLIKDGIGEVSLAGNNSFTGPVTINHGNLWAQTSTALGNTTTSATVNNGGSLSLAVGGGVLNFGLKPLVLNGPGYDSIGALFSEGTCSWGGAITLGSDSIINPFNGSSLSLTGAISGAGSFITYGPGTNTFSGSQPNTYAGTTTIYGGTLVLNKSLDVAAVPGNLVINSSATVRLANSLQTANFADVLVNGGGLFDFSTFATYMDTLHGLGTVNFGLGGWIYLGLNNGSSEFDGAFTGTGFAPGWTVGKTGSGTFTLGGNSSYTAGITHVLAGKLFINGDYLTYIPVTVDAGATLGGTGSGVGDITANGIIAPGNPGSSPGIFSSGNVTFNASGTSGNFTVALTGTNAGVGGYDQMIANGDLGSNTLANAILTVVPAFTTPVAIGQQFVIINGAVVNNGPPCCPPPSDVVFGTFKSLPEGANFNVDGLGFQISYLNYAVTLTLTSLPPPPQLAGIQPLVGGSMQLNGSGITNLSYTVLAATNLPTTNWISIGTTTAPANTNTLQFTDPNAASFNQRFYRFSWP